ncbi:MAG: aminotransferase class IV, partial [Clostridiales bacterium]|nr:aminotransferase class IV [Clostridiales bacterium]
DNAILPGTARERLLRFSERLGYKTEERSFTLKEMLDADEIVVHSTSAFCVPVKSVDGISAGGKAPEMLKTIQDALVSDFESQCSAF